MLKLSKECELSEIIFTLLNKNGFGLIDSEALRKAILQDRFLINQALDQGFVDRNWSVLGSGPESSLN